jgi:hypothetical protein
VLRQVTKLQGAEDFDLSEETTEAIYDLLINMENKYLILQAADDMSTLVVKSTGALGTNYDDFYEEITGMSNAVGMIWVDVEGMMGLFVSFYAGENVKSEFLEVMKEAENEMEEEAYFEGVGVTIAFEKKDMVLENVLQRNKQSFTQRMYWDYDYFLDVPEFEEEYEKNDEYNEKNIALSNEMFDASIETAVNRMKTEGIYKYVMAEMVGGWVNLEVVGNTTFWDLRTQLIGEQKSFPRIMFYKFEYENKEQIICLFLCEVMKLDDNQEKVLESLKNSLSEVAIPLYPIIEPDYFDLDILINI